MSDHILKTIQDVVKDLEKDEAEVRRKKQLINMLCEQADIERRYADSEISGQAESASLDFLGDEFHREALNSAIRNYLTRRKGLDLGPATAAEIHSALLSGGYSEFDSDMGTAMNSLKITLGKSSHTFTKLPNNKYGLNEWYGDVKPKKKTKRVQIKDDDGEGASDQDAGAEDGPGDDE